MVLRRWTLLLVSVLLLGVLAACGEAQNSEDVGEFKGVPNVAIGGGGGSGGGGNDITVDSADGGTLKFAQETLSAATGTIKVTFNNKGIQGLLHNWVLVKPGDEQKSVDESTANAPSYEPTATFVGHTKTINGGESDSVEFEVAEAGTYSYICTFPGHYAAGMKGTMTIAAGSGGEAAGSGAAPAGGGAAGGTLISNSAPGGELKFAEETLEVAAGEIEVTFNNKAISGLLHNWVLVKPGDEQKSVDESIANAPSYEPTATFVGHTKTINGGESDTTKFAVEPGTYSYICTFPGHYQAGMKGTLTVK